MPIYPKEFVQRLREELPISEVIGRRVPIKRKGREYEACCPFHQEKTPSFTINDAKGFYHCFGCSAHGDSLKFLMDYEKLAYPEAIEALAREAGIALPTISPEMERREQKRQNLHDIMAQAAVWFRLQLRLAGGSAARDYIQQRGLAPEIVERFGIGYAPEGRYGLKTALLKEGATEQQLQDCGLIIRPDHGEGYDRFRSRLMFPILDAGGHVIAFGGRQLVKDDKSPKYLNSPETELFHKGQVLYNWKQARAEVEDDRPLLVAEGYMDVIALDQAGFRQGVAPLGTALTEHHLKKLWQACDAPIMCLDGDAAGQRAMWRSAELALPLLMPGKTLKFCVLPGGQDPDDFIKSQGPEAFRQLLGTARPLSQVVVSYLRREIGEDTPEQRASLEARLEGIAAQITNASLQQHFRRYFKEQLWQRGKPGQGQNSGFKNGRKAGQSAALPIPSTRQQKRIALQRQLLKAVLSHPELIEQAAVEEALSALHMDDAGLASILGWVLEMIHAEAGVMPEHAEWPEEARALLADESVTVDQWHILRDALYLLTMRDDLETLKQEMIAAGWEEKRQQQISSLEEQIQALESRYCA